MDNSRDVHKISAALDNPLPRPLSALLREMAPGLEQCMYCGEDEGTGIDHFEPLARNRSPPFPQEREPRKISAYTAATFPSIASRGHINLY